MTIGTTPTHYFYFGYPLPEITALYVSYSQYGTVVVEKELADVVIAEDRNSLHVKLTQTDTNKFTASEPAEVQIRFEDTDGNAYATRINQLTVGRILKKGEM